MKTIETTITVLPDGSIKIPPQPDLAPGRYRAVLVPQAPAGEREGATDALRLKMLEIPGWPADARFRREELYDDERR